MKILIAVLVGAVLCGASFLIGCSTTKTPPPLPVAGEIKVHWIKKGEKAPFDGILMDEKTYELMRIKIEDLKKLYKECEERCR